MTGKSRNGNLQPAGGGPSFEEALARLEDIVRRLEGGDLPLEESIRRFQEGMALARLCSAKLDEAERRLEQLLGDTDGEAIVEPFPLDLDGEGVEGVG